jgi:hypothetical protein
MKPTKLLKEIDTIDNEKEHNKVLFELGILDDMEDWPLYQKQEDRFNAITDDLEVEEYFKLMGKEYVPRPIPKNLPPRPRPAAKLKLQEPIDAINQKS